MTIHREGYSSIGIGTLIFGAINFASFYFFSASIPALCWVIFFATLFLLLFLVSISAFLGSLVSVYAIVYAIAGYLLVKGLIFGFYLLISLLAAFARSY